MSECSRKYSKIRKANAEGSMWVLMTTCYWISTEFNLPYPTQTMLSTSSAKEGGPSHLRGTDVTPQTH